MPVISETIEVIGHPLDEGQGLLNIVDLSKTVMADLGADPETPWSGPRPTSDLDRFALNVGALELAPLAACGAIEAYGAAGLLSLRVAVRFPRLWAAGLAVLGGGSVSGSGSVANQEEAAVTERAGPEVASAGRQIALGIDRHLDAFASKVGAESWKSFAMGNPDKWKESLIDLMNDPTTTAHFNLEDVEVWKGLARAAAGRDFGATDWELLQFRSNPDWWTRTIFYNGTNNVVGNPFR